MRITRRLVVFILLIDAVLWGFWFGGLWSFRSAFASRLTDSYIHISVSFALPLATSSVAFVVSMSKAGYVRLHRVRLFKLSIVSTRLLYLLSSLVVYLNLFSGLGLLYVSSALMSIAYAMGSVAGVAWTDYVADNIPDRWKPRYIALDNTLSTVGALIGTAVAGLVFLGGTDVSSYGRLFLLVSIAFLLDVPLIMLVKEFATPRLAEEPPRGGRSMPSARFYVAIVTLYAAINLPTSLVAPYTMHRLGGDEMWITTMNAAGFIASLTTPIVWGEALRRFSSLTLAKVAVAVAVASTAVFPFVRSIELQAVRAFIGGAGGIGMWISLFSHIVRDADASYRVQHSSTMYLIQNLAPAVAVNIGGALADTLGLPEVVFLLSAIGLAAVPAIREPKEDLQRV